MLRRARELDERRLRRSRHRETSPQFDSYLKDYKEIMMAARPDRTKSNVPPGLRGFIWLGIFAALLFVPAGTLRWPGAWAFLGLIAVASVWGLSWLERHDPELLAERLRPPFQREQPRSDKLLMAAFMPLWFGWYVLMAFDKRVRLVERAAGAERARLRAAMPRPLALLAGVEGEQLRRTGGEAAEGARAQGCEHRPLRLCAPSHVCERDPVRRRRAAPARIMVGAPGIAAPGYWRLPSAL